MELTQLTLFIVVFFITQNQKLSANVIQSYESLALDQSQLTYDHYRLPTSVRPESYKLKVITYLEDPTDLRFEGEVLIKLRILEDTNNITLHAWKLNITDSKIKLKSLEKSKDLANDIRLNCIKSISTNERYNYLIMKLCNVAKKGEDYSLNIPFEGLLNDQLRGYYRSSYKDRAKNETRWLAVTQFSPVGARMAFPCFDEPNFKATFTLILGHHKQYTALSNMPLKNQKPMSNKEDWVWTEFEESISMSTYLVAYTINDFVYVASETTHENSIPFRTWTRSDFIDQCNYASFIAPKIMKFYEQTFDLKFPLSKIDQIALPDFLYQAMENWGLITYKETALLYAENVTSFSSKSKSALLVGHELAHQWFGNLVTMEWWGDLWLKEGPSTYWKRLAVNNVHPNWGIIEIDTAKAFFEIYKTDAQENSPPISQHVTETSKILQIFGAIPYKKGSLIMRMMHHFLGEVTFLSGIKSFLRKHAYQSVKQDDLWNALDEAAQSSTELPENYKIKTIMDSWTLQAGYPIITVTRDYEKGTATFTQSRFLLNTNSTKRIAEKNCWWVPLSYTTRSELDFNRTTPKTWLECNASNVAVIKEISDIAADDWVLFNLQMSSVYKVKYDERNWNMLIDTLTSDDYKNIHVMNRAQLINDALTLAWSERDDRNNELALRLIEYLTREKEYIPWMLALDSLASVQDVIRSTPEFRKFIVKILTPIYKHLNGLNATNPVDESTINLKVLIAKWACDYDFKNCIQRSLDYFNQWRSEAEPDANNPIPADLRKVVYCNAIKNGNENYFKFLMERYWNSNSVHEKGRIFYALGCSQETQLLERSLKFAYHKDSLMPKSDSKLLFDSILQNEVGFPLAKDFFVNNLQLLYEYYSNDISGLTDLLQSILKRISNQSECEELKEIFGKNEKNFLKMEQNEHRALETAEILRQCKK